MRRRYLYCMSLLFLAGALEIEAESDQPRRWSLGVSGGPNVTNGRTGGILLHKGDGTGNLLLGSMNSLLLSVNTSYEFIPGISVSGIFSHSALDAGTDLVSIVLPDAPSSIQVATGSTIGYAGEVWFDWDLLSGARRSYFFDPDADRKFRGYLGLGFGQLRPISLQTSSEGRRYIKISGVEGSVQNVLRLAMGLDYKLGVKGWVAHGQLAFSKRLFGELLTVNTDPSSEFESGELLIGTAQLLGGLAYHF